MEGLQRLILCCCVMIMIGCIGQTSVEAMKYTVDWSIGTDLQQWADQYTFYVGDELYFQYTPGQSSVLVVTEQAYTDCNIGDIVASDGGSGNMVLPLDTAQTYYFIAGDPTQCNNGLRLLLDVLPAVAMPPPTIVNYYPPPGSIGNNNNPSISNPSQGSNPTNSNPSQGSNPGISNPGQRSNPAIFHPPPTTQLYRNSASSTYSTSTSLIAFITLAIASYFL